MAKPQIGSVLHGFAVRYIQDLPEIHATLYRMEYTKNGADLVWLDRPDDNKTFAIAFKTIPQDNTGVFHILEHCLFSGSQKYPVKEPFTEIQKGTLATYLNAITFPDKTVFPASSRNTKDFCNLVDMVLDAVFHPLCRENRHAFLQEGWHYEPDPERGGIRYNGVVLNEMRGAYTDPNLSLRMALMRVLFPDNCYQFQSGGEPESIPDLTYEQFCAAHQKYYHPSNARIFLDGTLDLDVLLEKLDKALSPYDRVAPDTDIPLQAPVSPAETVLPYDAPDQEDLSDKAILAQAWVYGTYADREKDTACGILAEALRMPLRKAILEQNLAQDVSPYLIGGIQQPFAAIYLRNARPEDRERIWTVIEDVLREQADGGLDHERLHGLLNRMEFNVRQSNTESTTPGLGYSSTALNSWLYGGDPAQNLCFNDLFDALREKIDQGWFEDLLRQIFLDNPHRARACLLPSATLGAEKHARELARLDAVRAGWDDAAAEKFSADFAAFQQEQARPDTPEDMQRLPMLTLEDIPQEPEHRPGRVENLDGITVLRQDADTNGILYLTFYFDIADLPPETLVKLPLFCRLMGDLSTAHYEWTDLRKVITGNLGGFSVGLGSFNLRNDPNRCRRMLRVEVSLLQNQQETARTILREVLQTTRFEDKDRIRTILRQMRMGMEQMVANQGDSIASLHAGATLSAAAAVSDIMQGITLLRWHQQTDRTFEEIGPALLAEYEAFCKTLFTRDRLTLSVTGEADKNWLLDLLGDLPTGPMGTPLQYTALPQAAVGFQIPAEVGFAALCAQGEPFGGRAMVASHILSLGYLWNEVRVKGGAYGARLNIGESGGITCTSYRDPQCSRTLEVFRHTGEALRAFCQSGESLDKYIISTIGDMDPVYTPRSAAQQAAYRYFTGRTQADFLQMRSEVLHTTREDLLDLSADLDRLLAQPAVCVVGGAAALQACGDWIQAVEPVSR